MYFHAHDIRNERRTHNKPLKYEVNAKLRDISLQQQRLTGKSNNHTGEPVSAAVQQTAVNLEVNKMLRTMNIH